MTRRPSWLVHLVGDLGPPGPPISSVEAIPGRRAFFERAGLRIDPRPSIALSAGVSLRARRGGQLTAEVIAPRARAGPWPVVVYLHGGAWCVWEAADVRRMTFALAERGHLVISVNYGLAPELPFPCAVEDAVYAARWAVRNAADFGGDASRLAIGGDSSGANLAAAASVYLGDLGDTPSPIDDGDLADVDVPIAACVLVCGAYDFGARMAEPPTTPGTTEVMSNLAYLGPHFLARHGDPLVSPLRAARLDRFPPAYLACGALDSVLPQTLLMTEALARAGVSTTVAVPPDGDHEFLLMDPVRHPWVARELARLCDWLAARLGAATSPA